MPEKRQQENVLVIESIPHCQAAKVVEHGEPVLAQSLILISLLRSTLVEHLANVYKERITAL